MDSSVPRRAIAAFEQASGLSVTVRDLRRTLVPFLGPTQAEHVNPICRQAKDSRHAACIAFCGTYLMREITGFPGGIIKRCHAGVVELALPVSIGGVLEWILYAGLRRAGRDLGITVIDEACTRHPPLAITAGLAPLRQEEAAHRLELLSQLGARLAAWRVEVGVRLSAATAPEVDTGQRRRREITWLVAKRHPEPGFRLADLARHLDLSEDRAGHVVHELFSTGFAQLVLEERLRTAQALLELSRLPLREIVRQSGFGSRSQFFAAFRRANGLSPAAYRQQRALPEPVPT